MSLTLALHSAALTLVTTTLIEAVMLRFTRIQADGRLKRPFPSLAAGLLLTVTVFTIYRPSHEGVSATPGVGALIGILAGGLILLFTGLFSELRRPRTFNHTIAACLAGITAFLGGIWIPTLTIPGIGTFPLPWVAGLALSMVWAFLVIGVVELCRLLPLAAGVVGLIAGGTIFLPVEFWRSYAGMVLCGALLGAIPGRMLGEILAARSHPLGTSETLVLGYIIGCATLSIFLKSVLLGGFMIPLGIIASLIMLAVTHSLDSSLVLRGRPRG